MKKTIIIIIMAVMAITATAAPASAATTDKGIVKAYCMKHYSKPAKYVKAGSKAIRHRTGKKYVTVEVVKTKSFGKYGKTADGYRVKYNKRVKKGKTVTSYLIYNPKNNAGDDVVAVVDNRKIR